MARRRPVKNKTIGTVPITFLDTVFELREREFRLLHNVANRLLMGQRAFGPLSRKKKRWRREALEEAMDGMVYLGAAIQDLDDEENGTD